LTAPLRTLLVGLGSIGVAYAEDKAMARTVPYVTHAQVLRDHPAFSWEAAVDTSEVARERVRGQWGIARVAGALEELGGLEEFDVAVLATPPSSRISIIARLPNLRAVVVEKPLGASFADSDQFRRACVERGLVTQVNLTRRADQVMRGLANGGIKHAIGEPQCGFGVYGNGIINYATHTVDLVRMLLGEVVAVQALSRGGSFEYGPLAGDVNFSFVLYLASGVSVVLQPLRFSNYREGSLDIWGTTGRLEILQEGLLIRSTSREPCRSLQGAHELAAEEATLSATGYGHALYDLYDDLARALSVPTCSTCSPVASALATESIVHHAILSARNSGMVVEIPRQ
jgi:predicted dehydrogenase